VPGIGPQRRKNLLRHFGSVAVIKEASPEELACVKGMNKNLARKIKEYL
jgi:excinuclease ABC subunit C